MSLFLSPRDILNASSSFPEVMGSMALASPHFPQIYFSRFPVIIPLCSSFFFPVSFFCKCPMLPVILSNVRVSFLTLLGKSTSTRVLRITAPPHTLKFLEFPFLCSFFPALLRGSGVSTGPSSACHHSSGEAHANYLALSKMLVTDYTAANIMPSWRRRRPLLSSATRLLRRPMLSKRQLPRLPASARPPTIHLITPPPRGPGPQGRRRSLRRTPKRPQSTTKPKPMLLPRPRLRKTPMARSQTKPAMLKSKPTRPAQTPLLSKLKPRKKTPNYPVNMASG